MIKIILFILFFLPNCFIAQFQQNSNYLYIYYYNSNINDYNNKKLFIDSLYYKLNNEQYNYIYYISINIKDSSLFKIITNKFENHNYQTIKDKEYLFNKYYFYNIQNSKYYDFYINPNDNYNINDSLLVINVNRENKLVYNIYNHNIEIYKITENSSVIIQKIKCNIKKSELVNIIFNYSKIKQKEED